MKKKTLSTAVQLSLLSLIFAGSAHALTITASTSDGSKSVTLYNQLVDLTSGPQTVPLAWGTLFGGCLQNVTFNLTFTLAVSAQAQYAQGGRDPQAVYVEPLAAATGTGIAGIGTGAATFNPDGFLINSPTPATVSVSANNCPDIYVRFSSPPGV